MKKLLLVLIAYSVTATLCAQTLQQHLLQNTSQPSFINLQKAFDDWAKGKDLSKEKGWKFYKRWENEQLRHIDAKGNLPSASLILQSYTDAAKFRLNTSSYKTQAAAWTPVGPFNPPTWQWDSLSQFSMGRINCLAFHPTQPNTIFVGVGQGGIWKTTNNGTSWAPLTDNALPILRISDIAIDPVHPDTMYASVGDYAYIGIAIETDGRKRNTHYGMGIYKTTDGGLTWNATGLSFEQKNKDESLTRKVVIDPANTQKLVAATTSGLYTSNDGGVNWTLKFDSLMWDLVQDPTNPQTLYAASGYLSSLKTGSSAIYKSTDFGNTWITLNTGIPAKNTVERIKIAISPTDPNYVYALVTKTNLGFHGLYQSKDAGVTWTQKSNKPNILHWGKGDQQGGQGSYDLALLVHPTDKNKIYAGGINIWESADEGATWAVVAENSAGVTNIHVDQHYFDYNKLNSKFYVCNDGGIYYADSLIPGDFEAADTTTTTTYYYKTKWTNISGGLNIRSFYRVGLSKNFPGFVTSGSHDNGSTYVDDQNNWYHLLGGDGQQGLLHPDNPLFQIFSYQFGKFFKNRNGNDIYSYEYVDVGQGEKGEWTTPMVWHPNNPDSLYAAFGNVWVSGDTGTTWTAISQFPELSGFNAPNVTTAMEVAASNPNYIYLTKRVYFQYQAPGEMWVSTDGGYNFTDITAGLPDSVYFTDIAINNNNPMIAWVTCAGFYNGVKVFKTTDAGATWTNVSYNLPNIPANCIIHHKDTWNNAVYIGTDNGVYYINDNLSSWQPYITNLPNVIVSDLQIHDKEQQLYASTFGRGIWKSDLQDAVGIKEIKNQTMAQMQLLPNINKGSFNVVINNLQQNENYRLQVIDITGRKVFEEVLPANKLEINKHYELQLLSGMYFVNLVGTSKTVSQKMVVKD